jgi:hypothetical protein
MGGKHPTQCVNGSAQVTFQQYVVGHISRSIEPRAGSIVTGRGSFDLAADEQARMPRDLATAAPQIPPDGKAVGKADVTRHHLMRPLNGDRDKSWQLLA